MSRYFVSYAPGLMDRVYDSDNIGPNLEVDPLTEDEYEKIYSSIYGSTSDSKDAVDSAVDEIIAQILRVGHHDLHKPRSDDFDTNITGKGLETHPVGFRRADLPCERRNAPGAIAAHLGLGSVGIEELHPEVQPVRLLDKDNPLASDTGSAGAEGRKNAVLAGK